MYHTHKKFLSYLMMVFISAMLLAACGGGGSGGGGAASEVRYFAADDGVNGNELWKFDGTAVGTVMVKDINATAAGMPSSPYGFTSFNGHIYFTADDGVSGTQLWKTDGTDAGTVMVKNINGLKGSHPNNLTVFNGELYFTASDSVSGAELWKTDGTDAGTVIVKDINVTSVPLAITPPGSNPIGLTVFNGELYFSANDGINGRELWKTDGTNVNTFIVDINTTPPVAPSTTPGSSNPSGFTVFNGALFFSATDGINGIELWKTDGTTTVMVKNINATAPGANSNPIGFAEFNGVLYFSADDGLNGIELWNTDGINVGSVNLNATPPVAPSTTPSGSSPRDFTVFNGKLYFTATDGTNGMELWNTDGVTTTMLKDINTGVSTNSHPGNFTVFNGALYFSAGDSISGYELWKTDGTATGTVQVKDINTTATLHSSAQFFTVLNGLLYFMADDGIHGFEWWQSDGTPANTKLLKDICPGTCGSYLIPS